MGEFVESTSDVPGHGHVDMSELVVPCQGEAAVKGTGPINGDGVEELKCVDQVLGILAVDVFDSKVVHDKGKGDWASDMGEEAWCVF